MNARLLKLSLTAAAALLAATPAYPWGVEGHKAVALSATEQLTPEARAHVVAILGSDDLSSIAVWMDELRSAYFHAGPLASDPDALRLNHQFPKNGEWHYADLPLGTKAYTLDFAFANDHDVVHMAEEAIRVLEGTGDAHLTKLDALRMLVHFVGDMHQPLHVGNGVFKVAPDGSVTLVTDPAEATGLPNDKGGNALFFGPGKYDELHAYWDTELVLKITGGKDPKAIEAVLHKLTAEKASGWASSGDYHHWPEAWATESLEAARTAYAGITYGAEVPDPRGGIKRIAITLPPGYDAVAVPLAEERLAKAGFHLAEVLNAIHWAP